MNEYSYQTLNVYKDAKALVIDVYRLLKLYPAENAMLFVTRFGVRQSR